MADFKQYPKRMIHSAHALAVFKPLTPEQEKMKGLFAPIPELLSPERYPDVVVSTIEQEKQYASKGYRPANQSNEEEYQSAILESDRVVGYKFSLYPKWKYHPMQMPVIVQDASEEKALGDGWEDSPVMASEEDISDTKPAPIHVAAKPAKSKVVKPKKKPKSKLAKKLKSLEPQLTA